MNRRNLLVTVLLILALPSVLAAAESRVLLRNPRPNVAATYASIASLASPHVRAAFRTQSASMQSDLWLFHLERFLNSHLELTDEQRGVVLEGVGLLATGITDDRELGGEPALHVQRALASLTERARTVLGPALAAEAFTGLGTTNVTATRSRIAPLMGTPECNCSSDSDWCEGNEYSCRTTKCMQTWGCGTLFFYPCTGICTSTLVE